MTGIAAASFFSNICQFGGCGLHFESLAELIVHIEDNHIGLLEMHERFADRLVYDVKVPQERFKRESFALHTLLQYFDVIRR